MEEEDNQDQEFSILKKSVIPNLLQDDFKSYTENETLVPTFLTEVCDDEVSSEVHEKRKCFEKDYDLRKTLMNEESFENVSGGTEEGNPVHSSSTEHFSKNSKPKSNVLDIIAAIGFVVILIELVLYML